MPVTAGYSGTPLVQKLGIKPGATLCVLGAPDGFDETLGPLPDGVVAKKRLPATCDVVLLFTTDRKVVESKAAAVMQAIAPTGTWWVCWPKKASKVPTDVTEDVLRDVLLPTGLVDNKVCAVDQTWSGLRFAIRRELR